MTRLPERKRISLTWWSLNAAIAAALVLYALRG